MIRHTIEMIVPFHDLDPMQVVWHGNYFKYFDRARFALFAARGIDLYQFLIEKQYVFPLTRTAVKHIAPLRFDDRFRCTATVTEARYKIAIDFEIRRGPDDELCTRASSEQVAVKMPDMALEFEIPHEIQRALGMT
ncbi:MAG: thioesterase family protein [Desulfosarcinaceae bacterium]|nr:thioesterase family protein [Desulfosarcinaceae bacterium]